MASFLTWLHLSDLHSCEARTGWDLDRVQRALCQDLIRLRDEYDLRPDLLVFTGDAAFGQVQGSSIAHQFEEAQSFFEEVRGLCSLSRERVFLVPGNHDVDRTAILESQTDWLRGSRRPDEIIELIRVGGREWCLIMERLAAYWEFLQKASYDHLLQDPKRLVYAQRLKINGLDIGIAGLNSAWSCQGEDRGQLWLGGEWQLKNLEKTIYDAQIRLGLIHHPLSWFRTEESPEDLEPQFARLFDFHLHGHDHKPWVHPLEGGTIRIAAGACYDRQRHDRPAGYNLVRLDVAAGLGEVWLRQYQEDSGAWIGHHLLEKSDLRGVWELRKLRCVSPSVAAPTPASRHIADSATMRPTPLRRSRSQADTSAIPPTGYADEGEKYSVFKRMMRRRCREIVGGSRRFREIFTRLIAERSAKTDRDVYLRHIRELSDDFEKTIAMAALYEDLGQIEQMLNELSKVAFSGKQEASRRLFRAIGLEKLDRLKEGLDDIHWVLRNASPGSRLMWAAQFNSDVCLEKLEQYNDVSFERFIANRKLRLSTGEFLWHKALSMELIVCIKSKKPFKYSDLIPVALEHEINEAPSGYVKTLINWAIYKGQDPSPDLISRVRELELAMSTNGRAALLHSIATYFRKNNVPVFDLEITETLKRLAARTRSKSVIKFYKELCEG